MISLVCGIYRTIYNEDLDPSMVQLHLFSKTTVEFNNQLNEGESVGNLLTQLTQIITNSLQTLEQSAPLIDPEKFLSYIQNLIKDIDPNTESLINEDTIKAYTELLGMKLQAQKEQLGLSGGGGGMM